MKTGIAMIKRIVPAVFLLLASPVAAQVTVNIDATTNDSSSPVVVMVAAGTYQAKLTGPPSPSTAWSSDTGEPGTWGTHYRIQRTSDLRLYYGGRAAAADSPSQAYSRTPNRALLIDVPFPQPLRFFIDDSFLSDNQGGVSVRLELVATQPGRTGANPAGQLRVSKVPMSGNLNLQWGASCSPAATDYAVYEGTLGSWSSHLPKICSTGGALSATITPMSGSAYYLVVPQSATEEGSYGTDSAGLPRSQSSTPCQTPSVLAECPVRTETVFIGMGDVDETQDYNGILRITETPPADSGSCATPRTPDASLAMNTWGDLTDGDPLAVPPSALGIFPHGIFYSRKTDELFIAAMYTTDTPASLPTAPIGSIGVLEGARSLAAVSPLSPAWYEYDRHVYHHGWDPSPDRPQLDHPHSVWYDDVHQEIYVANSSTGIVSVFDHRADGNAAPRRTFTHAELNVPVSVAYDATTDTLFVGTLDVSGAAQGQVAIFKHASTRPSGTLTIPPDLIVYDSAWGHFIHNVWYDPVADTLWIGNHSETVYRHSLDGLLGANEAMDFTTTAATCSLTGGVWRCDLAGVQELALNVRPSWPTTPNSFVTGGIWFDVDWGRLYVSVGERDSMGPVPGPPDPLMGTHAVLVFDNARVPFAPASPLPNRTLCWDNVGTYYGPQPVSVLVEYWPASCGDGVVDSGETCDAGALNSDVTPNACRTSCVPASCGDGVVDSGETCDAGALNSDVTPNACRTSCVPASCGDGVVDSGETCDAGALNSDVTPNACRTSCVPASCGDGVVDSGETCDAGNTSDGDGCSSTCQFQHNVLLIIADDLGVDNLQAYHTIFPYLTVVTPPTMPNVDTLAANGVTFSRAWSNPTCTPTRAGLYSGFHAFEHGLTHPGLVNLDPGGCGPSSLEEKLATGFSGAPALPGVLPGSYRTGLFGKWHVGGDCTDGNVYDTVNELGWDYYDGSFEDIKDDGLVSNDYCSWPQHVIDGVLQSTPETMYATDYVVTEALSWVTTEQASPWFATVAFNVPHTPLHDPATCDETGCSGSRTCFLAMVEDLDDALGQLLTGINALGELQDTIVIFIADNGTDESAAYAAASGPYPTGHYKSTVYEGGVNVPLIIADGCHMTGGTGCTPLINVPGRYNAALVQTLDLFGTIRGITDGTDDEATYGRRTESMVPYLVNPSLPSIRSELYTDSTSNCTIRRMRYKLILPMCSPTATTCEFYDLQSDPTETSDLLTGTLAPLASVALGNLKTELARLRGWSSSPCPYCGDGVVDSTEGCDDGALNSDVAPDACRTSCVPASCGDGVVDSGETCDDGALNSDVAPDTCRTSCVPASCGDGVVDSGETCDAGALNSDVTPDACRTSCVPASCGDGVVDSGEQCDDGNTSDGDGCSSICQFQHNVLLIIADDLGVDNLQAYHTILPYLTVVTPPTMPNVDALAANGVTFSRAWSNPTCTPTRAGVYSGFHAFEHGLTHPGLVNLDPGGCGTSSLEQALASGLSGAPALAGVLPSSYKSGLFGKWHVGGDCTDVNVYDTVNELGWDYYDGSFEDIKDQPLVNDYCSWPQHVINGVLQSTPETTYATDYVVTEALAWIGSETASPWFATVAFNVPHTPLHDPSSPTCDETGCSASRACYLNMVEDMDDAIGQLLTGLSGLGELSDTIVIFIADNGTEEDEVYASTSGPYPTGHYKGTVYEGGVNVPLIIADGCSMAGGTSCASLINTPGRYHPALATTLDLFGTIRQVTRGTDDETTYGRRTESLFPYLVNPPQPSIRTSVYTESPSRCAIRGLRYKLILDGCDAATTNCEFYDLQTDPTETSDLLIGPLTPAQTSALNSLKATLRTLRGWSSGPACP